jgi:4-hydroxyphenylpyruvate dioxygenase
MTTAMVLDASADPVCDSRMQTSIATVSLSGTLDRKLAVIADTGFGGVEIFENDLLGFDGNAGDVGRIIRDLGLICTCFQPFRDFEGLTGSLRTRVFDRVEAKFDVMEKLGAKLMLVCSSVHRDALGDINRTVDDFHELARRAQARGLKIGYEALAWGRYVYDHRQAWDIVRRVNHPAVGLILDSFHSLARKIPMDSLKDIEPDKLFLLQIADAPRMPMEYLYWSRHYRCFPSQGDLEVAEFVRGVLKQGYRGPLSLEIFNDRFREWSTSQIAVDGLRSLILLKDQAKVPPALLPRTQILGVDFIEFAVHGDEIAALGSLLAALGFTRVGTHRTKNVTLWRQGAVHLVLNSDDTGWARQHWHIHGASVCAIALRVASARAALDRAASLNIETFVQAPAEGELEIPWIRGVGGALTYFTEPDLGAGHWTNDFLPTAAAANAQMPAFTRVDYFSQTMRIAEFLSWQLHYTCLFDVAKTPTVEVADTFGLVQTQAIESPDASFRVLLDGSPAGDSLAARFIEGGKGAGVQHIALETHDIFSAAQAASTLGLEVLTVPPNYYDDVQVRFSLPHELTTKLRRWNIFFDRDDDGEYFQLFSRAFNKRFFFEIAERRGYRGYGLANTNVRLAAQARYKPSQPY